MAFTYTKKDAKKDADVIKAKQNLDANSVYSKSAAVLAAEQARDQHAATKIAYWTGGQYGQFMQDTLDKINNREKFTYDINGDPLYQQYKDRYIAAGKLASADAIGQAAAMTGGYGNSYAAAVGNQAYQSQLQQLNDVVPELYQLALGKYQQEGQDLKDQYSMYRDLYNTEYGEYRDKVADWNTEQSRLENAAYNEANMDYSRFSDQRNYLSNLYSTALNWATNQAESDYNNAFARYQQQVSEDQWNKSYALQKQQANQSAEINALKQQIASQQNGYDYYKALYDLQDGIKTPFDIVNQSGNNITDLIRAQKTGGTYTVLGKQYKTQEAAEKAVATYLDNLNLTPAQINDIYNRLGL